ncbi:MAG: hypothetical protein LLF94_09080, partial [Chlamydiales bacterium]|nr:hypothetical protein [Chlamydiales bacterium]
MPGLTPESYGNQPIQGGAPQELKPKLKQPLAPFDDNAMPAPSDVKPKPRPTPKTVKTDKVQIPLSGPKENTNPTSTKKQGTILSGMKTAFLAKAPKEQQASYEKASAGFEKSLQDLYQALNAHSDSKMLNIIATKAEKFQSTRLENPLEPEKASAQSLLENTLKLQALTAEVKAVVNAVSNYGKALQKFTLIVPTALQAEDSLKSLAFAQVLTDVKDFMNTNKPNDLQSIGRNRLQQMTEKLNQLAANVTTALKSEVVKSPSLEYEYESKKFDSALQDAYKALTADPSSESLKQAIKKAEAHQQVRFRNPLDSSTETNKDTLQVESVILKRMREALTDATKSVSVKNEPVVPKDITPQEFVATLKKAMDVSKSFEHTPAIRDAIGMAGKLLEAISNEGSVTPELMQQLRQVQDELQAATSIDSQTAVKALKDNVTFEMHVDRKLPEFMTLLVSNYSIHEDAKAVLEEKLFAIAAQKSDVNSRGDFVSNL